MTGEIVAALQYDEDSDVTAVFAAVDRLAPSPPKKAHFSETYKLPEDRSLVIDQGWLNLGCDDVLYEMYSGKLDAKWNAKYVGEDEDGNWLYQMTQDFDWKKAVFESYDDSGPTGGYFDVESTADMDALVRVVDPYEPIWPGNVEPIDGQRPLPPSPPHNRHYVRFHVGGHKCRCWCRDTRLGDWTRLSTSNRLVGGEQTLSQAWLCSTTGSEDRVCQNRQGKLVG